MFTLFVAPTVVNYTSMKIDLRTLDTLFKEHLVDIKHQGPFVLHPLFQKFHRSVKQFLCCLIVDVFFSSSKIGERFLFLRLSPPGDQRCDVRGFVSSGSVSSSSKLRIYRIFTGDEITSSFNSTSNRQFCLKSKYLIEEG